MFSPKGAACDACGRAEALAGGVDCGGGTAKDIASGGHAKVIRKRLH